MSIKCFARLRIDPVQRDADERDAGVRGRVTLCDDGLSVRDGAPAGAGQVLP